MPNLLTLILQIGIILLASRLVGFFFRRIDQPQVVGEMAAGILLGPSLLGWLSPTISAWIFPPASLGYLNSLSQIGLILFMFLVGLELDLKQLRALGRIALVTSQASIFVPFLLGLLLSFYLYPRLSSDKVSFTGFAFFMGAAMSVTAFPVLARILTDRGLVKSRVGTLAIACAAVGDVSAWCILAAIIALVRSGSGRFPLWLTFLGLAVYLLIMLFGVRRVLPLLLRDRSTKSTLSNDQIGLIILVMLASSWTTEFLGVHALFGAFFAGVIMPKRESRTHDLIERFEALTVVLLLPLFFAFTGLRTSIQLISGLHMWLYCFLIIAVAVMGKFGGATLAARLTGVGWRESVALGVLLNTRGLIELVILNIGLDIGVLSPTLFSMMVIMALFTTFLASPLLTLLTPQNIGQMTA